MSTTPERRRYAPSTVGTLRGFLLGLQGFSSVVHELLQNAEDAGATEFYFRFTPEALWVGNDEIFEEEHFNALSTPAAGSKRNEVEKIGSFGIGFTSVYQLTDAPEVMSRGERHTLRPLEDAVDVEYNVKHEWETTICLPWAFEDSEVRAALDSDPLRPEQLPGFLEEAKTALRHSAVFLSHIRRLRLFDGDTVVEDVYVRSEGDRRVVRTLTEEIIYRIYEAEVHDSDLAHLILDAEREGRVRLAVPEKTGESFQGYFYAALPTQERTFMPFHLDADFYPHSDRKSLLWDGNDSVKQRWNAAVLRATSDLLPAILEDLRLSGAPTLYAFAQACLAAPARAAQTRTAPWVEQCAQIVRQSFNDRPLLLGARTGWVTQELLTVPVPGLRMPSELQCHVEDCAGLAFPPDDHLEDFAVFFEALNIDVLDADRFIAVLPHLLRDAPLLPAGSAVWAVVRPTLTYLRQTLDADPSPEESLARHSGTLRTLPFAVDRAQRATTIESVWHAENKWSDILDAWFGETMILSETWAVEAGPRLAGLLDVLTPDSLVATLTEMDKDKVIEVTSDPAVLRRLYTFLSSAPFNYTAASAVPLCRGRDGKLYPAVRTVLPGEIRDPFGVVAELDPALAKEFRPLFSALDVQMLDGDRYFGQLLPQLAREQAGRREQILRHLAASPHLNEVRRAVWREVPIVRTADGQWVLPSAANFEHPLLERLFPGTYHAVANDLAEDQEVHQFLELLGVTSTPTPENLARIVRERAGEPVTEEALTLRYELVRHALANPEVLKHLQDVPWLPDATRLRWWPAGQLWSPRRRLLVGREAEPGRTFLGLDLTEKQAHALGLAEPQVDTVLRHLTALKAKGEQMPPEVLPWLEGQRLSEEQVRRLRELPLFRTEEAHREAGHFFLKKHKLAPHRGLLSEKYTEMYPQLVKTLGIREEPRAEDYAAVLLEISRGLSDGGRTRPEVSDLVKYCLNQCAGAWKRKEPEPAWLEALRAARVIPVGIDTDDLRILRPRDTLRLDLPERDLKRYALEDAIPYCVQGVSNTAFLRTLGVRGVKDVLRFRLLSTAGNGVPSAYTQQLQNLVPVIVRYLHDLHPDKTPEDLERDVSSWRFISMPVIHAELSFPAFTMLKKRRVELEHEVDHTAQAILLKRDAGEFVLGVALEQALGLGDAPHLSALLTYSPAKAEEFLDAHKVGPLPEGFKPSSSLREAEAVDPGPLESRLREGTTATISPSNDPPFASQLIEQAQQPAVREPAVAWEPRRIRTPESISPSRDTKLLQRSHFSSLPHTSQTSGDQISEEILTAAATTALREQNQHSAWNAAARRDRIAGETDTNRGTQWNSVRQVTGAKVQRAQTRFRNYVYASPLGEKAIDESRSEHNRVIDAIGMQVVTRFELLAGRTPQDCSDDPDGGYDIRSGGSNEVRLIEVKTLSGPWGPRGVTMSRKQLHTAFMRDDRFWLYVVECAASEPKLWCIQNPAWLATSYTFADDWANATYAEGPFSPR